jgi:hypothetical protein
MSSDKGFAANAAPRKWKRRPNGAGFDPLISGRAPAPIVEMIVAKAKARKVPVSAILREALENYVRNSEERNAA